MLTFLRSERPMRHTFRPSSSATSIACCTRWTLEANDAMRMRPLALRDDLPEDLADRALGLRHAGALRVRRVAEEEVDAAVAEVGEGAEVGAEAVHGRVVDLVVAGVDDAPARGLEDDCDRVRDRVRHAHELRRVRPDLSRPVLGHGLDRARRRSSGRARRAST